MKLDNCTFGDVHTSGGRENPPCAGLVSDTLPEAQKAVFAESSDTGVSTRNAVTRTPSTRSCAKDSPHWYALRTTYGREKKAYDYMVSKGIKAFYPTISEEKTINNKRTTVIKSRLPNIFFAFGTEAQMQAFVYDNINLPYLRFYYRHIHIGRKIEKQPMIIPDDQMNSLMIICEAEANDIIVSTVGIPKFEAGELVRIVEGAFTGVIGRVARYQGQQRVAVIVNELMTMCTAYIPSAFLQKI